MQKIELRKVRDFGALFNDGLAFLKANFKSFFGAILYLAGPFIIITAILSGYMQSLQIKLMTGSLFKAMSFGSGAGLLSANFLGTLGIFVLIAILTTLVTTACVCLFFKEYDKVPGDDLPIQRSLISPNLASAAWRLFYNALLLGLIMSVVFLLVAGVCALLFMVPVLNVLLGIALVIGMIIILPVFAYVIYIANFIVIRDEILITQAIGKAIRYLKGNFWWTWLLVVAVSIAAGTLVSIFTIPLSIINVTTTFTRAYDGSGSDHSIMIIIFGALSMVAQLMFVTPILYTFCILNFYNHEERHEGSGLMDRINQMDAQ